MRNQGIIKPSAIHLLLIVVVLLGAVHSCNGFLNDRLSRRAQQQHQQQRQGQTQQGHFYRRAVDESDVDVSSSSSSSSSSKEEDGDEESAAPLSLLQQAEALRQEANSLKQALEDEKALKQQKETAKIDSWIDDLFIQCEIDENTQMLNSVDQVFERLKDDRYSYEQVDKIFKRICETGPAQSRSNCSPIMTLLVDAVGKLDCVEKKDNPNKRWSGKVERVLRKRLFALDWGFELEDDDDNDSRGNPWRV